MDGSQKEEREEKTDKTREGRKTFSSEKTKQNTYNTIKETGLRLRATRGKKLSRKERNYKAYCQGGQGKPGEEGVQTRIRGESGPAER